MQEGDMSTGLAPGGRAGLRPALADRLQASPVIASQPARATWLAEKIQQREAGGQGTTPEHLGLVWGQLPDSRMTAHWVFSWMTSRRREPGPCLGLSEQPVPAGPGQAWVH